MKDGWKVVKSRDIGSHRLELIALTVDGFEHHEIIVDCVVQFIGTRKECEGKWRKWVHVLKKIAQIRDREERGDLCHED